MPFTIPPLPIPPELMNHAKVVGAHFASQETPRPPDLANQKRQMARLRTECAAWASQQTRHFKVPRKNRSGPFIFWGLVFAFISLMNELPLIFLILGAVSQFIGIHIAYTNTLGAKNPTYIYQRTKKTVDTLASVALLSAVTNLAPTRHTVPVPKEISLTKKPEPSPWTPPLKAEMDEQQMTSIVADQPHPLRQATPWTLPKPEAFAEQLGITRISITLSNLHFNQIQGLKTTPQLILIYINGQNRKMNIERYINFMAISKASNKTGVIFSPSGFTQGTQTYAEKEQGAIFDVSLAESGIRPLTSAARALINSRPSSS